MDRSHVICWLIAACAVGASVAHAREYKEDGRFDRTPPVAGHENFPFAQCNCLHTGNVVHGQHACCGCGCAHSGFYNWCGHGKKLGWAAQNGGLLPRCDRRDRWTNYYYGYGYGGYGGGYPVGGGAAGGYAGYGYGGGPAMEWGGYGADLFYNYYAPQTGIEGGVPVDMYPAPHETPYPAIQVYYTYQPWMPHEFLYEHNRRYIRYHSGGLGATATQIEWGNSPLRRHKY